MVLNLLRGDCNFRLTSADLYKPKKNVRLRKANFTSLFRLQQILLINSEMIPETSIQKISSNTTAEKWRTAVSIENPELLKKAREELKEDPESRDEDIQKLRNMISKKANLTAQIDDQFLLRFLRARKFDVRRAFKLLKHYYKMKVKYANLFSFYRPSLILNSLNENLLIMFPRRDQLGRSVLLIRCGQWDPFKCTADECLLATHMCVEKVLPEEETQVNGVIVVLDMKNFGFSQARHGTPGNAKKFATSFQDCLPARFKGFHFIFESPIFDIIYLVIKPFLTKKARSRTYFHGNNLESLHEHVHPEFLPEEYGGQLPPTDEIGAVQLEEFLSKDDEIANSVLNYGFSKGAKDEE